MEVMAEIYTLYRHFRDKEGRMCQSITCKCYKCSTSMYVTAPWMASILTIKCPSCSEYQLLRVDSPEVIIWDTRGVLQAKRGRVIQTFVCFARSTRAPGFCQICGHNMCNDCFRICDLKEDRFCGEVAMQYGVICKRYCCRAAKAGYFNSGS